MSIKSRQAARNKHSPAEKNSYWSIRHKKNLQREIRDSLKKGTFGVKNTGMNVALDGGLIDF